MNHQKKIDDFMEMALERMFEDVGASFSWEHCKKQNWYLEHRWTPEKRSAYRDWFIDRYIKTFKATKKSALWEWAMFNLNYGWRDG